MVVTNDNEPQALFFAGRINAAKERAYKSESQDDSIMACYIDLWRQEPPERVYAIKDKGWRDTLVGSYFTVTNGDTTLLDRVFDLQRQNEIAAFFRAFGAWKQNAPCPNIPVSDEWSKARRTYMRSWFEPYQSRVDMILRSHESFLELGTVPDAARTIRQAVAIAQETGSSIDAVRKAFTAFAFPADMITDQWKSTIAYARLSYAAGDTVAAQEAYTACALMGINPLQTRVETAGFALAIGENSWARDQIAKSYVLYSNGERLIDYFSSPVLSGMILSEPKFARMMKDFAQPEINDSDDKNDIRMAVEYYVSGITMQTEGHFAQAERVYLEALRIYESLGFIYRAAIVCNRLQQVSWSPIVWREKALSYARQFGGNMELCVRQTLPRVNETKAHIIECALQGMDDKEIARNCSVAVSTVKNNLHEIYEMLGVGNRHQFLAQMTASKIGTIVPGH